MRGLVRRAAAVLALASLGAAPARATGPHPSATPAGAAAAPPAAASRQPIPVVFRVRPAARAHLGWTGLAHDQVWPAEQRLAFALDCSAGAPTCAAVGGAHGDFFGAPIPLSAGSVPACVVNRLRTGLGGTIDPKTGCGDLQIQLTSTVFTGEEPGRPCPTCVDDPTPNDGRRDGRCRGGTADGKACDGQGVSPVFGVTSNDCEPSVAKNVGDLAIDLAPLTTRTAGLGATLTCKMAGGTDAARCACPGQLEANACVGGRCDGTGRCPEGPIDGRCGTAPYRGCRPGTEEADCEATAPGSGRCETVTRPCVGDRIEASGRCGPEGPTFVAVFCTPQTRATALNSAAGLPGPSRIVLPLERVE